MAVNLGRNLGYRVFPVGEDKRPRLKDWPNLAASDETAIRELWRRCPDPLVGIATGAASGVWVLDLDAKHVGAADFWNAYRLRILPTRVYRTRSGGLHCYFTDGGEQRNSAGRPVVGVDVRGNGGYVVAWFAAGHEVLDDSRPAPWPAWLADKVAPPKPSAGRGGRVFSGDSGIRAVIDKLASTTEGDRNGMLFWSACRLTEKGLKAGEIEGLLLPAALSAGLPDHEARRTIASAARRAEHSGG